jgi:hypothetical protein
MMTMHRCTRFVALALVAALALQSVAWADTFTNVKLMVNTGEKAEEQDAVLRFEDDALVIYGKAGTVLKTLAYADLKGAEYSYSKSPRWKSGIGVAVAVGIFALPVFFMKGKKHWLTIAAEKDFAVLRLDKRNYKLILPTFEARTGRRVEAVSEEK